MTKVVINNTAQQKTNPTGDSEIIVQNILEKMSLEEKAGQVFIMSLRKIKDELPVLKMNQAVKDLIRQFHLGGIILFGENLYSPSQTKELIDEMKMISQIPLFMAIDEEGGAVSRLNENSNRMQATKLPRNSMIGRTKDPGMAYKAGMIIGRELASLGFNMNFAPVADISSSFLNPYLGPRAFGSTPKKVAPMVAAGVEGLHSQNVIAILKHFPGHGATIRDTHTGAVIIRDDREKLNRIGFVPFLSGINAGADGIMAAHLQVPKITGDNIPATLSKKILTDILRAEMKFDGLIITDALEMAAVAQFWSADEAAIRAFEAGADILLMPSDLETAYTGFLNAIHKGRISEKRLNDSVKRILNVKYKRNILDNIKNTLDPEKILGCKEHLHIAGEITKMASIWTRFPLRMQNKG